jgi:hypothetical protein
MNYANFTHHQGKDYAPLKAGEEGQVTLAL